MDITHTPTIVTLAVTSSDPCLPLPNVLLMLGVWTPSRASFWSLTASVALPRLLPLRYVRLSVHSASQRILRLQTVTKTVYYLQLHHKYPEAVFALWSRLTNILENGLSTTTKDPAIPIRHCLVSSRSSSTSSISPLVEGPWRSSSPAPSSNRRPYVIPDKALLKSLQGWSPHSLWREAAPLVRCPSCWGVSPQFQLLLSLRSFHPLLLVYPALLSPKEGWENIDRPLPSQT
uniref:Golgi associated RAB2 interactor 1A n=1 Tax=Naja naja TaxID=35670 RepID=A0A8C6YJ75_NAJNA